METWGESALPDNEGVQVEVVWPLHKNAREAPEHWMESKTRWPMISTIRLPYVQRSTVSDVFCIQKPEENKQMVISFFYITCYP